jgi:hypothetical protein
VTLHSWHAGLRRGVTALTVGIALLSAGVALAQDTRAATIAEQQAEKAKALQPPKDTKPERILDKVSEILAGAPTGVYPALDSVYPGGGFTLGLGYRRFAGDRTAWNVQGFYSIKSYKLFEAAVTSPGHARKHLNFSAKAGWRDATQVAFYGLGMDTDTDDRSNFRLNQAFAGGEVLARVAGPLVFGAGAYVEDFTLKSGRGASPSIEERHTPVTAPALGIDPTYVHTDGIAAIDWRPADGYARRGGFYGLRYDNYADTDDVVSFDRLEADVVQHIPLLRETFVLSLHGRVQTTLGDDTVPFFLLPALGSGSTLRGYSSWRFRDRHSLLLQGEYRWIPNRLGLDMAIFYDAGKVVSRRSDLDLDGLKSDVGIGVRLHGPAATPVRIELAKGSEGLKLVFAGSAAF